jgi:pimeloyl-ACP methyl ester carboxylesterase
VPLFLLGKSLGGMQAFNLSVRFPTLFSGLTLVAPFFRHYTDVLEKYKWGYKFFNLVQFFFSFSSRNTSRPGYAEYMANYAYHFDDPKLHHLTKISTICYFLDEQEWARKHLSEQRTPVLIVNAQNELVVRNTESVEILKKIKNPQNKLVEIRGADHTTISIE